ncbi:hypothetical protein TSAR_009476 [Trichomalopsis sarcophagae]|uniref:Uncharacterized protein n=1 Tax=Trichomalopsis sarcophagae TaxID=543379 RepID=A0A232FHS8_9HYME|nr:hypothetical protein TSAR_009476 [Trichomalopsis sarcophagae]
MLVLDLYEEKVEIQDEFFKLLAKVDELMGPEIVNGCILLGDPVTPNDKVLIPGYFRRKRRPRKCPSGKATFTELDIISDLIPVVRHPKTSTAEEDGHSHNSVCQDFEDIRRELMQVEWDLYDDKRYHVYSIAYLQKQLQEIYLAWETEEPERLSPVNLVIQNHQPENRRRRPVPKEEQIRVGRIWTEKECNKEWQLSQY